MDVYVVGLGHIGLPLACWIALKNKHVRGYDINEKTIEKIKDGTINIEERLDGIHIGQICKQLVSDGVFSPSSTFERTSTEPGIFMIVVGIANSPDGTQDISPLKSALNHLSDYFVDGDLIMVRTTLIPGTCDKIILPILKKLPVSVGLAYCPETLMETKAFYELENNPMILSADTPENYERAFNFIKTLTNAPIYKASNIITAEMTKVIQNVHRDVNIALSNEVSNVSKELGVNVYELQTLVNTHPRVDLLTPGPGVGGYCLPNAYEYLKYAITKPTSDIIPLIKLARELNYRRPGDIIEMVSDILRHHNIELSDAHIAQAGLAMKDFCADCRFSPAVDIASELRHRSKEVRFYDPISVHQEYPSTSTLMECIDGCDCLIVTANQEGLLEEMYQLHSRGKLPKIIIDTRNFVPHFLGSFVYSL